MFQPTFGNPTYSVFPLKAEKNQGLGEYWSFMPGRAQQTQSFESGQILKLPAAEARKRWERFLLEENLNSF